MQGDGIAFMFMWKTDPSYTGSCPALLRGDDGYYTQHKKVTDPAVRARLQALSAANDSPLAADEDYGWLPYDVIDKVRGLPVGEPVTEAEFLGMFRTCQLAFRYEHQRDPLPFELAAFAAWQEGNPLLPEQWKAWGDWLDYVRALTEGTGRQIMRVRLLDDPITPYQECAQWATPYHHKAGDDIRYMPRARAAALGIIPGNWELFDDDRLVVMDSRRNLTLITDEETITVHRAWRDLALAHAPAGQLVG